MNSQTDSQSGPRIRVETRILGWGAEALTVPLPSASLRVADLIRAKVAAEWGACQRGERTACCREAAEPDALDGGPPPTLEAAWRAALDAYRAGWYIILVDGEEPGGLDARLELGPSRPVAFVRVYPLPGASRRD